MLVCTLISATKPNWQQSSKFKNEIERKMWNLFKVDDSDTRATSMFLKVLVTQIEKALITDRLRVSKISGTISIPTLYAFAVIYPQNLLFS